MILKLSFMVPYFAMTLTGIKCVCPTFLFVHLCVCEEDWVGSLRQKLCCSRNKWVSLFPKIQPESSSFTNKHTHTYTHCPNKPAQLTMTHFMFPIVAWLVGLEYFACILCSSCESHTLTVFPPWFIFSGNDLLWPAQQLSTVCRAKHNTRLSNNWARFGVFFFFFFFFSFQQSKHSHQCLGTAPRSSSIVF